MPVTHDLVVKTGTYIDQATGEAKNRYQNIGFVMKHPNGGTSIKIECLPVCDPPWNGWASVYPKDDQRQGGDGQQRKPQRQQVVPRHEPGMDDDVPF
ncbi:Helix-destabilizing protein [Gammaproteobacteria bacterium]